MISKGETEITLQQTHLRRRISRIASRRQWSRHSNAISLRPATSVRIVTNLLLQTVALILKLAARIDGARDATK